MGDRLALTFPKVCARVHMNVWMTLWAPKDGTHLSLPHPHFDVVTWLCLYSVKHEEWMNLLSSSPMPSPGLRSWTILTTEESHSQTGSRRMWSFLMFPLIGKKKRTDYCILVSGNFYLFVIKRSQPNKRREENLCFWQAPRQSWIIYLFCNSFLSNILFLYVVIKNWNASFSVDILALTICLTLHKLFSFSELVFLSVSTVPDTTRILSKYL